MHLGAYYLCVILGYKLLAAVFQDYWIGFPPGHCQTGRSCPSMRHSRKRSSFLLFLSALVALMGPAVSLALPRRLIPECRFHEANLDCRFQ